MKINPVSQSLILTPRTTGYGATVGMALTVISGISKNKTLKKAHKPLSYVTAALTAFHIGLIEYYHHKYKKH